MSRHSKWLLLIPAMASAGGLSVAVHAQDETGGLKEIARIQLAQSDAPPSEERARLAQEGTSPATDAEAEVGGRVEEITVTARRREESLMETPVSVTAFTTEMLDSMQLSSIDQISESAPGLMFRSSAGPSTNNSAASVYIRGVGQGDFVPTVEPGVGLYVDDVYLGQIVGSAIDLADIESVQVLRGPQGTLFGRNTIGGAIVVQTVKPNDEFSGYVDLTVGNFSRREVKSAINIPFSDTLFGRFSILARHKDGFVDTPNIPRDDGLGSDDTLAGRVALRWMPSDTVVVDFAGSISRAKSDGPPFVFYGPILDTVGDVGDYNSIVAAATGQPLYNEAADFYVSPESYKNYATSHFRANSDLWDASLTVGWDIGELHLKSITAFRGAKTIDGADGDHSPLLLDHQYDLLDGDQFSQEFQLSGTGLDGRLDWLTGLYYFENDMVNVNELQFPLFDLISGSIVERESSALFGQLTYDLTDKWSLTLGGRFSKEKFQSTIDDRIQFISAVFDPSCIGSCPGVVPGVNGLRPGLQYYRPLPVPPDENAFRTLPNQILEAGKDVLQPYVNFSYRWNEDLLTYLSYSEGFKSGGFNQRLVPGGEFSPFNPEYAGVYELGVKWSGFNNKFRLTSAVFYTDYKDLQVAVSTGVPGGRTDNAAGAEIKGGEIEMDAYLTDSLQLIVGLAYLDAKYTKLGAGVSTPIDNVPPVAMDWQRNASLVYRIPMQIFSGKITARVDYSHTDSFYVTTDNDPSTLVPGYSLVNASISYTHSSDRYRVALQARNVLDEFYLVNTFNGGVAPAYGTAVLGPPAEYSLNLSYRY